jgi:carboxyl-terminal processing protease
MGRRILVLSSVTALVVVSFLLGTTYSLFLPGGKTARKVAQVYDQIRKHYPGDVPADKLERAAVEGMLGTTDPWAQYFTAAEWKEWSQRVMTGRFYGVGIRVESDPKTGYLRVISPMENSPAFDAGILPGDLIVGVDGADIQNRPLDEVTGRIKGDAGTTVVVKIRRGELELFDVTLTRAEIKNRAVKHRIVGPGIGYIRIEDFTESVPKDFEAALRDLQSKGMMSVVVDLRFNGGGLLSSAVELCDLWLPPGRVVAKQEGKRAAYRRDYAAEKPGDPAARFPTVILVNRHTASASEIVAGALRDHGLAPLVGSRTFGKGLVQSSFDLSDGSHVKLTTARWLTPNGEEVGAKGDKKSGGLMPDHLVEMSTEEEAALLNRWTAESIVKGPPLPDPPPPDFVLEAGIEVLRAKLEKRTPDVKRREVPEADPKETK